MQELSKDLLPKVIETTPGYTLFPLSQTCTRLQGFIDQRQVWARKIQREFPIEAFHFCGDRDDKYLQNIHIQRKTTFRYANEENLKKVYITLFNRYFPKKNADEKTLYDRLDLAGRLRFAAIYGDNNAIIEELRICSLRMGEDKAMEYFSGLVFLSEDEDLYRQDVKRPQQVRQDGELKEEEQLQRAKLQRLTPYFLAAFNGRASTIQLFHSMRKNSYHRMHFVRWIGKKWEQKPRLTCYFGYGWIGSGDYSMDILRWACRGADNPRVLRVVSEFIESGPMSDTSSSFEDAYIWKPADKEWYEPKDLMNEAIRFGRRKMVRFWLAKGVEVTHYALLLAIEFGHEEVATLLLKNINTDMSTSDWINVRLGVHGTPLHHAALCGRLAIVKQLMAMGADPNVVTEVDSEHMDNGFKPETPINLACFGGHEAVVEFFIAKKVNIDHRTLLRAIDSGKGSIVIMIQNAGVTIESVLDKIAMFVNKAVAQKHHEILSLLCQKLKAIAPQQLDELLQAREGDDGFTLLHKAVQSGFVDSMRVLLEAGADVNMPSPAGISALHLACTDSLPAVELLLEYEAVLNIDADMNGHTGVTALHVACFYDQPEIVSCLIEAGAVIDIGVAQGFTPLHAACHRKASRCVDLLLKREANIEAKGDNLATPLMVAAQSGCLESVTLLCAAGAEVNAVDVEGCTPLHFACLNARVEIIVHLLRHGANLYAENNAKKTPKELMMEKELLVNDVIRCARALGFDDVIDTIEAEAHSSGMRML